MDTTTENKFAIIGAGPAGLCGARNLQKFNIPFDGYELHSDVGGLWDIKNPQSTMYKSAHLISSKTMTEIHEFPMHDEVSDFPHWSEIDRYFKDFTDHFKLREHYHFNTKVKSVEPIEDGKQWKLTTEHGEQRIYRGVIIANGTLHEPNWPKFKGEFTGEYIHSASYKDAEMFKDKRVLIVGAGNSGCDIAVDAVHHAKSVDMSVRRGYHFIPKYIFGKPADTLNKNQKIKLPPKVKQKIDSIVLKAFTGDPARFGFPRPDHKLYESHPIINSLILHYLGHGDLSIKPNIDRFEGKTVYFTDGSSKEYDMVLLATGYKLYYPFIDQKLLNWKDARPNLYLNIFHPEFDNLFILGMIEAAGIGWQGRYDMAELIARYIKAVEEDKDASKIRTFKNKVQKNDERLDGGFNYIKLDRMAYYVHKDTYLEKINENNKLLS